MKRLVLLAALCLGGLTLATLVLTFARIVADAPDADAASVDSDGAILFLSARLDPLGDGERYAINADGSRIKRLRDDYGARLVWSPDATKFAFDSDGLSVADADGRNERLLVERGLPFGELPTWSPDGSHIAYSFDEMPLEPKVYVLALDDGPPKAIADGAHPAWSPNGESIAFVREDEIGWALYLMSPDGSDQRRLWPPVSSGSSSGISEGQPEWSSDGRQLAYMTYEGHLAAIDADGTRPRILAREVHDDFEWSPTSPVVAFSTDAGRAFIVDTESGRLTRLGARLGKVGYRPSWSPDGKKVALSIEGDLWVITPTNMRSERLLSAKAFGAEARYPQWEAGGRDVGELVGQPVSKNLSVRVKADVRNGVLRTGGIVGDISADGGQVALRVGGECPHVEIWERERGTLARFPVTYDCSSSVGAGIGQVSFSSGRAVWIQFQESNHFYLDVVTATAQRPFQEVVFSATDEDADHLLASDGLFVFTTRSSAGTAGSSTKTTLWGVRGARATRLLSDTSGLAPAAVGGDRIVISRGGGRFDLLSAFGRRLGRLKLQEDVRALAFAGHDFVALRQNRLEWVTASGRVRRSWSAAGGHASLAGVAKGMVAYVAGRRVHILRLRDGRRMTVNPPGRGTVRAALDETGVFYAYAVGEWLPTGRVGFIALTEIGSRLR